MRQIEALAIIDLHKALMTDPRDLLMWTWLRVIISKIPPNEWEKYVADAALGVLSK